jgi:hypothetical protein
VIEKDATFQSLVQSEFIIRQPHVVLLTVVTIDQGKGFPDVATRSLLRLLYDRRLQGAHVLSHTSLPESKDGNLELGSAFHGSSTDGFWSDDSNASDLSDEFWMDDDSQISCKIPPIARVLVDADPDGIEIMLTYKYGSNVT